MTSETLWSLVRRNQIVSIKLETVTADRTSPCCRSPRATFRGLDHRLSSSADALPGFPLRHRPKSLGALRRYAASGTARARARASDRRVSMTRSA